jgi:hypothetical protein
MSWNNLWAVVFFSALAGFAVISALIAVMGVGEIRELFAHLAAGRRQDGSGR